MPFFSRKSPRILEYDYTAQNYYFVTLCTKDKKCLFGKPDELNVFGEIAKEHILHLPLHYSYVRVDKYVVMPNHIHMILAFDSREKYSLSNVVGLYKSGVTKQIHQAGTSAAVWQRSFHDHVIRNQQDYEKIWRYIHGNPGKWDEDCYNNEEV